MSQGSLFPVGDSKYDATYAEESAMVDASELIAVALESSGKSRTALARALGVSKSEVTDRLTGERNITVKKLAATLHALGAKLTLSVEPDQPSHNDEVVPVRESSDPTCERTDDP